MGALFDERRRIARGKAVLELYIQVSVELLAPDFSIAHSSASDRSQRFDNALKLPLNACGSSLKIRIVDSLHGGHWINRRHFSLAIPQILDDDIARKHRADLILNLERLVGQHRIACAKDAVAPKVDVDLLLQGVLDVDLRNDAEAFLLQNLGCAANSIIETDLQRLRKILAHSPSPVLCLRARR